MTAHTDRIFMERAETLAKLYLTRRPDLEIFTITESQGNHGYDLLVRIAGAGTTLTPEFGVNTKGIDQP